MKRPSPYADANQNAASQMQHMSSQRMQHNARMNTYPGRSDSLSAERGHSYVSSRAEGQWQWDRDAQNVPNSVPSHLYSQGQGGNVAQSLSQGRMVNLKADFERQANNKPRSQSHEQDMEIGYEDGGSSALTFEGLQQKFQDELMNLVKERYDAEDAENARHREKVTEINTRYQEKLSSLRTDQANQREEYLRKESQDRLRQYQQPEVGHHTIQTGTGDHHSYNGASVAEARGSYGSGQNDLYRERSPFFGGGVGQGTEARIPYPEGRAYNNTGARYYSIH